MDRNREEITERINFDLTGELAEWMSDLKRRGLFVTNPEIVRLSLTYLRHHYRKIGVINELEMNESKAASPHCHSTRAHTYGEKSPEFYGDKA